MIDALLKPQEKNKLSNPKQAILMLEGIVEKIDMTMILPPVTVKFPHAVSEITRILDTLEKDGFGSTRAAEEIRSNLKARKEESYGYSTFVMIAESHLSVHTFPEFNYFSFDCYSCKFFDEKKVIEEIKSRFDIEKIVSKIVPRGIPQC